MTIPCNLIVTVLLLCYTYAHGFRPHIIPPSRTNRLLAISSEDLLYSIITSLEPADTIPANVDPYAFLFFLSLGQLVPTVAFGLFLYTVSNNQINAAKDNVEKQIAATNLLIKTNQDNVEKQIKTNQDNFEKQIKTNQESTDKLIKANYEICEKSIKASELKIENILSNFTPQKK